MVNKDKEHELIGFNQFNKKQHFEVHVTIMPTDNIVAFQNLCYSFAEFYQIETNIPKIIDNVSMNQSEVILCKPIIIVLPQGVYKQQPMCSLYVFSTLHQAVKYGELFANYIEQKVLDFKAKRNKVEARLRNIIPNSINLNSNLPQYEGKYWEFHIKLTFDLKSDEIVNTFRTQLMKDFPSTRLSKSAMSNFDVENPLKSTRIVTLRIYNGTKEDALVKLKSLEIYLNSLSLKFNYSIRGDIEKELSVYDSNVSHDVGWIDMKDKIVIKQTSKYFLVKNIILLTTIMMIILSMCKYYINI